MVENAHWQVQEAKQRFSEVLRAVEREGPQFITRHGDEVAVMIDINEFRRLTQPKEDFKTLLRRPPYFDDTMIEIMDQIEADRQRDFGRPIDLGFDS